MAKASRAFKAAAKILGFDCAGSGCAAAVLVGDRVAASRAEKMERGQAARLIPLIAETLQQAGLVPADLDLIAVTTGPGGFTGIRIGLAAARGLALAAGIPAVGVSNFAVAAAKHPPASRQGRALVAAIESKREEFYLQVFAPAANAGGECRLVHPRDLQDFLPAGRLLLTGDAAARLLPWLKDRDAALAPGAGPADPSVVARLGLELWQKGETPPPRPLYLRAPDTTQPRARTVPDMKAGA